MSEDNNNTSLKTKWFEISGKKTAELITVLSLVVTAVIGFAVWEHKSDTRVMAAEFKEAQHDVKDVLKEIAVGLRENNCLTTFKEEAREAKAEFCKRISR